ncbi:hypothetical protein MLD38_032604 [Melastoma candidum]|uniref:Uncharacterized protein n=1 Tax=Melastoma candidum TaxID=119954 RepID=A0ACB9M459_9MYRT|nr:hypothetical protein MLD38_032604 [Melastoma candidum]
MGRYKFRLSDMIPRAWLRKLGQPPVSPSTNHGALLLASNDNRSHHVPPSHPPSPLHQPHQRKSYHFSRQFDAVQPQRPPSPPRRSTTSKHRKSTHLRRKPARPRRVTAAVLSGCSCRALAEFDPAPARLECRFHVSPASSPSSTDAVFPQSPPSFGCSSGSVPSSESFYQMVSWTTTSSSCRCRAELDDSAMLEQGFGHDPLFELKLEPLAVVTKPREFNEMVMDLRKQGANKKPITTNHHEESSASLNSKPAVSTQVIGEKICNRTVRVNKEPKKPPRPIINSAISPAGGMRLRVNSPKLATRKLNQARLQGRKGASPPASSHPGKNLHPKARKSGISEGIAVVKSSVDPWKDFGESMVEMIVENDIRESKDLEELLACYLMLNSDSYHDLIIGVFKQIWSDFHRPPPTTTIGTSNSHNHR